MQIRATATTTAKVPICTPRGWQKYPSEDPQGGGQKCPGFCATQTLQTTNRLQTSIQEGGAAGAGAGTSFSGAGTTGAGTAGADGGKCGEYAGAIV